MTMKSDAKFEEKPICCLTNFHQNNLEVSKLGL